MKKTLIIIGTILLLGYLLFSRGMWFPSLEEEEVRIGSDRLTKNIDISSPTTITWEIGRNDWSYVGEVHVGLVVDKLPEIPREAYSKETMDLVVKVDAYATIPVPFRGKKGLRPDRLINNWYFTTNTPLSPDSGLWESGGSTTREYGLCGVERYSQENTCIVVTIENADPVLAKANPRLEVVGEHDYAVSGHLQGMRIFRDTVLIILSLSAIFTCAQAIKK
ncbi:MAG: hypothetical protein K9M54_08765 [Kiritimatiellales bacterium]|nr:hypothetical protein [Kiritimatiellales bacterium]